jgi:signal transduction histidine kinase
VALCHASDALYPFAYFRGNVPVIAKTRVFGQAAEDNTSGTLPADQLHEPAARQALDTLLAIQMQLELATGVPVALYGPLGQTLPGISPIKYRQADHQTPPARNLLAPESWPQHVGQMLEVMAENNLYYFITPFVVGSAPIAQVILGPLQLFEPGAGTRGEAETAGTRFPQAPAAGGAPDTTTDIPKLPQQITFIAGVPVLASWKARAAAEITRTLVSHLCAPAPHTPISSLPPAPYACASDHTIAALAMEENTIPSQHALTPLRLGTLAHDAMLPERRTAARLQRVTESINMIDTPPEEQDTTPLWPAPPRPLAAASIVESETPRGPVTALRHVIEAMPQAVLMSAAPDGHIVLANRAARALWPQWLGGPGTENETSAPLRYLVTNDEYPSAWQGLSIALRQAESFRGEVCAEIANGSNTPRQVPMLVSAFPLRAASNHATHAIAIFEDLSGLTERERFKDELLLMATHDVRNPLTLISSHVQLLERNLATELPPGQTLERARERLNAIQAQVQELTELTSQLSLVTRLQSAQQRPTTESVNLARLIQRAAIDQQMLTPARTIEAVVEDNPCLVQGDQAQLHHICMTLLKNATRYSHLRTPVTISVRSTPSRTPLWAEVSVRDEGIGIPRASQPHMFERFYSVPGNEQRARAAGIRMTDGTGASQGLGLYLCKQLLEQMGGRIWLESAEGQGTTISFALPLKG